MSDSLNEKNVAANPIDQFRRWFDQAKATDLALPEAMTLATCDPSGRPSARLVLLKKVDDDGFVFYTNYQSSKARQLEGNPAAALVFYWPPLDYQVRVEGSVTRTSAAEADEYFQSRPRESQIGAIASPQSEVIESREVLEQRAAEVAEQYRSRTIARPAHWGGYRLRPERIEFWKSQPGRLHDRILYERNPAGGWTISRLAP